MYIHIFLVLLCYVVGFEKGIFHYFIIAVVVSVAAIVCCWCLYYFGKMKKMSPSTCKTMTAS